MKIKIDGWLYVQPNQYNPANPSISFWAGKETKFWVEEGYVPICAHTIEVDAPDVDIIGGQVQCLLAKRKQLAKDYETSTRKIDDAISKLKCLTFDSKGVAA